MLTVSQFLLRYPQFGGVESALIQRVLDHALTQYDSRFASDDLYLALTAHVITTDEIAMAQSVARMDQAVGVDMAKVGAQRLASQVGNWRGDSLNNTPYGQEVMRMLLGVGSGGMYLP
jgi:Protein of unknown function (DUF4054)